MLLAVRADQAGGWRECHAEMGVEIVRGGGGVAAAAFAAAGLLKVGLSIGAYIVVGGEHLIEVVRELEGIVGGEAASAAFCGHGGCPFGW
jgi:hypothetical protein